MAIKETKTLVNLRLAIMFSIAPMVLLSSLAVSAQQVVRGTIKGTVTADQGQVTGFRVSAHNLDRRLWYTVFTVKGHYTVPQALPGKYEMMVYEPDYDSPKVPVQLGPGDNKTADLAIKMHVQVSGTQAPDGDELGDVSRKIGKIEYVSSLDEVFPPGPGLDLLRENCTGCHADTPNGWGHMHYTKEAYLRGIERMTETGPGYNAYAIALGRTIITKSQKEILADYLVKNFGPGTVEKRLRIDPLVVDEDVASKMIYVSYEIPDLAMVSAGNVLGAPMVDGIIPQMAPPEKYHHLGSVYLSPKDGDVYFTSRASSSILQLNPRDSDPAEQWKNYAIKGDPYVHPSGLAIDKQGRVYWAELKAAMLGELDPATGKQIRHALPEQAGAVHEVVVDKDGNVGFDLIWGAFFGRMEATSRRVHMYPTPTPDNGMYGLAVDKQGNLWGAGWQKGTISKWDVETESVKEYKVPNSWGQVRRISVDSKGIVWASEYITGMVARLDPATGQLTEYKIPLSGAKPYEAWTDKLDNVWLADQAHSAMIKLDPKTGKFTFYPMPQPHQSVNKIQVADDNTIWLPTRGLAVCAGVHFYPNGYTADSPPMP
jgi:virginiamycin B lyase